MYLLQLEISMSEENNKRQHKGDIDHDEETYYSNKKAKNAEKEEFKEKIRKVLDESNLMEKLKKECDSYFYDHLEEDIVDIVCDSTNGSLNKCMICNCDMGIHNPRQLCGKTYCMFSFNDLNEDD